MSTCQYTDCPYPNQNNPIPCFTCEKVIYNTIECMENDLQHKKLCPGLQENSSPQQDDIYQKLEGLEQGLRTSTTNIDTLLETNNIILLKNGKVKFDISKPIGTGSTGKVYYGIGTQISGEELELAIKTINKKKLESLLKKDQIFLFPILRANLDHPNIIKFYDNDEDDLYYYIIHELASHGNFTDLLCEGINLHENQIFFLLVQAFLGLEYLHNNGIIHGNLNPDNIFLDEQDNLKIAGFGWFDNMIKERDIDNIFLPPENEKNTKEGDIWSMGAIFYSLINYDLPENGKLHGMELQFHSGVSEELEELIYSILDPNIETRLNIDDIFNHPWIKNKSLENHVDSNDHRKANLVLVEGEKIEQPENNIVESSSVSYIDVENNSIIMAKEGDINNEVNSEEQRDLDEYLKEIKKMREIKKKDNKKNISIQKKQNLDQKDIQYSPSHNNLCSPKKDFIIKIPRSFSLDQVSQDSPQSVQNIWSIKKEFRKTKTELLESEIESKLEESPEYWEKKKRIFTCRR